MAVSAHTLEIGVHEFLSRALRSGSLSSEFSPRSRASLGIAIHKAVAAKRPAGYLREVSVRGSFRRGETTLVVRGRMDGLMETPEGLCIEEVKSTYRKLDGRFEPSDDHFAQLQLYHHFLSTDRPGTQIRALLTYVSTISLEELSFERCWRSEESRAFFEGLATRVIEEEVERLEWIAERDASLRELAFPFATVREGQMALLAACAGVMESGGDLLVEAATGIGKTMGTLYPTVKGLCEGRGYSRVFFLTAKSAGVEIADRTLRTLMDCGARVRVVQLSAKERMCRFPGEGKPECNPDLCPFAKGFFDRVGGVRRELLAAGFVTSEAILEAGKRVTLCPFELSLELTLYADVVICDYNYAFDPGVYLRRFFMPILPDDNLFIVDEAHNLVPRGREMYSGELSEVAVEEIGHAVGEGHQELLFCLGKLLDFFDGWRVAMGLEGSEALLLRSLPPEMGLWVTGTLDLLAEELVKMPRSAQRTRLMDRYFELAIFARVGSNVTRDSAVYARMEDGRPIVKVFCLNPGPSLRERVGRSRACIFISATLSPLRYYKELLGAREGCRHLQLPCPFPRANRLYLHVPDVSTKYSRRDASRPSLARVIAATVAAHRGNYLVFLPSYAYQGAVWAELATLRPAGMVMHVQRHGMDAAAQKAFLENVTRPSADSSNLGLAVMGGLFAEGIDLPGERLIGAIVVGPGLPGISREQELIRDYFDERYSEGFYWAYVVPGMVKVVQAAGRVFRTPDDRGIVILVDDRFLEETYRDLMPPDWAQGEWAFSTAQYSSVLEEFWRRWD